MRSQTRLLRLAVSRALLALCVVWMMAGDFDTAAALGWVPAVLDPD